MYNLHIKKYVDKRLIHMHEHIQEDDVYGSIRTCIFYFDRKKPDCFTLARSCI